MSIAVEQLNYYFSQLNTEEQESVLHLVETIAKGKHEAGKRISIDQYNAEIEAALVEAEQGKTLSHDEVIALSKHW